MRGGGASKGARFAGTWLATAGIGALVVAGWEAERRVLHSNLYGPVALGVAIAAAVAGFGLLAWLVLQWAGSQPRLAHGWPRSALQAATLGLLFLVFKEAVSGGLQTRQPEWSAMVRPISAMAALLVGADLVLLSLLSAPVPDHTTPRQSDPDVPP